VWTISFDLPRDGYLEYAFFDPRTGRHLPDPLNRRSIQNGFGDRNNFFYMPEAGGPTPLTRLSAGGMAGQVTRHTVPARLWTTSKERRVYLYHPPASEPVPLLVVYDGLDYFRRARLAVIVDNLIALQRIRPLALALLQNGGQAGRFAEYGCSEATLGFVARNVIPFAHQHLNLLDLGQNPGSYGVMGSSGGGLMAVFTAMRLPHIFGSALSQSGAFEIWGHETIAMQMARHLPKTPVSFWIDCGRMDFLLDGNRKMHAILRERGYEVTYVENDGAHNFTTWRDSVSRGLETLFA
jgi:enterochelin esterase family protein